MSLGRTILAELAAAPERADWRACKAASAEEEAAGCAAFKERFGAYDPFGAQAGPGSEQAGQPPQQQEGPGG